MNIIVIASQTGRAGTGPIKYTAGIEGMPVDRNQSSTRSKAEAIGKLILATPELFDIGTNEEHVKAAKKAAQEEQRRKVIARREARQQPWERLRRERAGALRQEGHVGGQHVNNIYRPIRVLHAGDIIMDGAYAHLDLARVELGEGKIVQPGQEEPGRFKEPE